MSLPFIVATMAKRGMLNPGSPVRVAAQLNALHKWGFSLAGELRQAAKRDPKRIAVIDEHRGEITYRQLVERSERLARSLHAGLGIRAGDRIGVMFRNHAGLIEVIAAGASIGAETVLINAGLSSSQLSVVVEEQRLRALLHDNEFAERMIGLPTWIDRVNESRFEDLIHRALIDEPLRPPLREGRTIVLTSGTTGTPKGARRRTPPGFSALTSFIDRIPLRVHERILIAAPIFHAWGYATLQVALALRATLVLQRRFDPTATQHALGQHRCTALIAVPVMLQRMLEIPPPAARLALRITASSGSALPGGLATRFMDIYGDTLYNFYGTTEASWASIATPADLRKSPTTAGRPPYGTRLGIIGRNGQPVSPGQVGRIFVGNEMLFEGYTSGATRESYGDLLSTGDVGHVDEDGLLYIDGREDDMIISGGENVYPSEVEDLLARLPQVREVAVIGVPDREWGQRLAAYLALYPGETLDPDAVREYVRRYRARFSVPRDVVFMRYLPRNATGKVMARELPRYRTS